MHSSNIWWGQIWLNVIFPTNPPPTHNFILLHSYSCIHILEMIALLLTVKLCWLLNVTVLVEAFIYVFTTGVTNQ